HQVGRRLLRRSQRGRSDETAPVQLPLAGERDRSVPLKTPGREVEDSGFRRRSRSDRSGRNTNENDGQRQAQHASRDETVPTPSHANTPPGMWKHSTLSTREFPIPPDQRSFPGKT